MINILKINADDTFPLRHKILRPHQPISQSCFSGDFDETTAHFGAFQQSKIIGIISIYKTDTSSISDHDSWQLRAMATEENSRGKGVGSKLLARAEKHSLENGAFCVWANARFEAIDFYKKSGYSIFGNEFNIDGIGLHYLVYKNV